jgi:hypothetical protein
MLADRFIFKIHRNGHVERVRDCNNVTVSDVVRGLGVPLTHIECKPINNSGIYAFYGDEKCDVLILGVPERPGISRTDSMVHGLLDSQFKVMSTLQGSLS